MLRNIYEAGNVEAVAMGSKLVAISSSNLCFYVPPRDESQSLLVADPC